MEGVFEMKKLILVIGIVVLVFLNACTEKTIEEVFSESAINLSLIKVTSIPTDERYEEVFEYCRKVCAKQSIAVRESIFYNLTEYDFNKDGILDKQELKIDRLDHENFRNCNRECHEGMLRR